MFKNQSLAGDFMITIKDHKQGQLFDPWDFLSPKRRKMLEEGWPGLFRKEVLCALPINKVAPFFCDHNGRPSKELYTVLAVLLLQQVMDLSDQETVEHLAFNIQWHFALNLPEESDSAKYLCPKTLWSMRQLAIETKTDQAIFSIAAAKIASIFNTDTDCQRLDSTHIRSNMRRLGRVGIFSQTIHKFLVNLKRHHKDLMKTIDEQVIERYLKPKSLAAFALVKPSQADKTLQTLSADLYDLIEQFKDQEPVRSMNCYKLMVRVLHEHCNLHHDSSSPVTVKPAKEIASDSLQNPSDPDATYDGHKGQGYQVQVMETYTECDDKEQSKLSPNLITYVEVQPACQSDAHAVMPAIEDTRQRELAPEKLLADAAYGRDTNVQQAAEIGVELVSPTMKGNQKKEINLTAFELDDNGRIISCPEGHRPEKVKYKKKRDKYSACFASQQCDQCPVKNKCLSTVGKKYSYVRYSGKDYRLAVRRIAEQTDQFVDTYRWRAGVEATMSEYKKLTGVGRLRVRGFKAVRYCATLKAVGVNLFRAAAAYRARIRAQRAQKGRAGSQSPILSFFKEQFVGLVPKSVDMLMPQRAADDFFVKLAA